MRRSRRLLTLALTAVLAGGSVLTPAAALAGEKKEEKGDKKATTFLALDLINAIVMRCSSRVVLSTRVALSVSICDESASMSRSRSSTPATSAT